MGILALPPSGIITDNDGIVIGRSSDGKGYLLTGGTEGQVPVIQGDGTIAYGAAGASTLSELDDWSANTLTVPGALTVRQAGGVAGTDEIQIYHDGTSGHIEQQSGNLFIGLDDNVANRFYGTRNQFNGIVSVKATTESWGSWGSYISSYDPYSNSSVPVMEFSSLRYGSQIGSAAGSTNVNAALSFQTLTIGDGVVPSGTPWTELHSLVSTAPIDGTVTATGGSGTDISGANLILAGGKPTGAGTPGQVQFQVAPSGASGTTLGTLTTVGLFDEQGLTVRQAGGVAGTDEVQIYHDGTDGYIVSQSGNLKVGSTLQTLDGAYNNTTLQIGSTVGYGFSIWQSRIWLRSGSQSICSIGTDSVSYRSNLQLVWGTSNQFAFAGDDSGIGRTSSGRLKVTDASTGWGEMISQGWALNERSSDPSDPAEGQSIMWQSDGTGSGDDGDIMVKITAGGVTKTTTLIDFSAV